MHEPFCMPCIFGCRASSDSLAHYLLCKRLWRAVVHATALPAPSDAACRLGLLRADSEAFLNLIVAFTTYHAVKNSDIRVSRLALETNDFHALARATRGHAAAAARNFKGILRLRQAAASASIVLRPRSVIGGTDPPSVGTISEPQSVTEDVAPVVTANVSNTRFVQGGDHFMTTAFTSSAAIEGSPVTWEEPLVDTIPP